MRARDAIAVLDDRCRIAVAAIPGALHFCAVTRLLQQKAEEALSGIKPLYADAMADKNLLPGWEAFQTDEGEWYYYHEGREETTWDKPEAQGGALPAPRAAAPKAAAVRSAAPVAAARPKMPAGGGMGGLLGDIQKGKP